MMTVFVEKPTSFAIIFLSVHLFLFFPEPRTTAMPCTAVYYYGEVLASARTETSTSAASAPRALLAVLVVRGGEVVGEVERGRQRHRVAALSAKEKKNPKIIVNFFGPKKNWIR